jgi:methionyl-tRNA synthetase
LDDPSREYPILTGEYGLAAPRWRRETVPAGQAVPAPRPIFTKLDQSVLDDENARLAAAD